MFITKKKHEAILAVCMKTIADQRDDLILIEQHARQQGRKIAEQSAELARLKMSRAKSNANLRNANAARSEAAGGKGE